MFLKRRNTSAQTLMRDPGGNDILNLEDFESDYQTLPRVRLIRQRDCCNGWEIGYFGVDSWLSSAEFGGATSPRAHAPGFLFAGTAPGAAMRADYGTDLDSFEVNYRRCLSECFTFVAGFRWIELEDEYRLSEQAPTQQDVFDINTNNHLYGLQTGFDASVLNCGGRFHLDTVLRAAIVWNDADQRTNADFGAGFVDTLTAEADHTSFFGELGIQGVYWLSDRLAIRGGYYLAWLEGVALAPDQIPVNSLIVPGTAAVDTSGGLFLDGATIGLMARF